MSSKRVPGDAAGHGERKRDAARGCGVGPHSTHQQDPACDERHSSCLQRRDGGAERDHADDQHEHGRDTTREGVDEAHVRPGIGAGEQGEVRELQRRRADQEGNRGAMDVPLDDRHGRARYETRDERHGRGGLGVLRTREQQVPARVHHRRRQAQDESGQRHAAEPTAARPPAASSGGLRGRCA